MLNHSSCGGAKHFLITPACSDTQSDVWYRATNNDSIYFDLLWYNEIDMAANNGLGRVVQSKVPLLENAYLSKPGMMACRHANGRDWWLLKGRYNNTDFHTFLVTSKGFEDKGIQQFPRFGQNYDWDVDGQQYDLAGSDRFLQRGEIKPRLVFEQKLVGFVWLSAQFGYRINGRFNLVNRYNGQEKDEVFKNKWGASPYFNLSINLVTP